MQIRALSLRDMAKPATAAITAQDLTEFMNTDSDFAFEMNVLRWLEDNGFECRHSGTYGDPVTGKLRQFDIRAEITSRSGNHTLALAVEMQESPAELSLTRQHRSSSRRQGFL
jgi:hypothetical protein